MLVWFSFWKLDERFGFTELGQCILQQINTFMRQEKLDRCFKVEGIEPCAPSYCSKIYKLGHKKPANFTWTNWTNFSWTWILVHRNQSEFAVSYRRSTLQISKKFSSCFSCFQWSIQWRFYVENNHWQDLSRSTFQNLSKSFAIHDQW